MTEPVRESDEEILAALVRALCRFFYTLLVFVGVFVILVEIFQDRRGAVFFIALAVGAAMVALGLVLNFTTALPRLRRGIEQRVRRLVERFVRRFGPSGRPS